MQFSSVTVTSAQLGTQKRKYYDTQTSKATPLYTYTLIRHANCSSLTSYFRAPTTWLIPNWGFCKMSESSLIHHHIDKLCHLYTFIVPRCCVSSNFEVGYLLDDGTVSVDPNVIPTGRRFWIPMRDSKQISFIRRGWPSKFSSGRKWITSTCSLRSIDNWVSRVVLHCKIYISQLSNFS